MNKVCKLSCALLMLTSSSAVCAQDTDSPKTTSTTVAGEIVSGTVFDEQGEPLIGASVVESGTANGTVTDYEGHYALLVAPEAILTFSYVGYKSVSVIAALATRVDLRPQTNMLGEIVVVGYGTQKRENLTGAVSTVEVAKVLDSKSETDLARTLQGVVPGLTITVDNGELDAKASMTIRGMGTLSSDACQPLIVVNGVPTDDITFINPADIEKISVLKDAASTSVYGTRAAFGVILITTKKAEQGEKFTVSYQNNFAWMTPTIQPDYPDVPTQLRAMISANDHIGAEAELFGMDLKKMLPYAVLWQQQNGGKTGYRAMTPYQDDDHVGDFYIGADGKCLYYADWDVNKIMFNEVRPAQTHNLSARGSSGRTSYYMSVSYNDQEGYLRYGDDHQRKHTFSMNLQHQATDWLQIGGRFDYSSRDRQKTNSLLEPYQYIWRWGSFFGPYGSYQGNDFRTEIGMLKQGGIRDTNYSMYRMGGFVKADMAKNLTLNADYTYTINRVDQSRSLNPIEVINSWTLSSEPSVVSASSSELRQYASKSRAYALNVYGEYKLNVAASHHFKFMAGGNAEEGEDWELAALRRGLLDYTMPEFSLATGEQTIDGSHLKWGACGYFARINYDWRGIYLLELNGRYDGSSKFPSETHWAFFPSASAGYRFSEEKYFERLKKVVTNGKLRVSFGEIGNQEVANFQYLPTIERTTVAWLGSSGTNLVGYGLPSLVSTELSWERIQTLDAGIDLGFLNNELTLGFDWFQRTTRDMLAPSKTLPQVLGNDEPVVNAGTLRTRGWELSLSWRHTFDTGLNLYAQAAVSDYESIVTEWNNDSRLLNSYYSGCRVGDIWGFETDRLFTDDDFNADGSLKAGIASQSLLEQGKFKYGPGDVKFVDRNGDGVIDGGQETEDDHGDLKVIGNTTPRYQYSFRLGGSWKGFDVDLFFQGVGKRDVWTTSAFVLPFARGVDALYDNQTDYYDADPDHPNPDAFYPRGQDASAAQGNISVLQPGRYNFYPQSRYLVNMAYLRFKNLTIGYTLPKRLTGKVFIQKARLYLSATNLCELINKSIAPVDPEINYGEGSYLTGTWGRTAPMSRTWSCGVQLTF